MRGQEPEDEHRPDAADDRDELVLGATAATAATGQPAPYNGQGCRYPHGMGIEGARGRVGGLVFGAMAAEVVFAAARLRVADLLGDGLHTAAEVAREIGADEEALTRLLHTLAALELVSEAGTSAVPVNRGRTAAAIRPARIDAFDCSHLR